MRPNSAPGGPMGMSPHFLSPNGKARQGITLLTALRPEAQDTIWSSVPGEVRQRGGSVTP